MKFEPYQYAKLALLVSDELRSPSNFEERVADLETRVTQRTVAGDRLDAINTLHTLVGQDAHKLGVNPNIIDEIVQDATLKVMRYVGRFTPQKNVPPSVSFSAYVMQTTKTVHMDYHRRKERLETRALLDLDGAIIKEELPTDTTDAQLARARVLVFESAQAYSAALPQNLSDVYRLCVIEGHSQRETADKLGKKPMTVRVQVARAKEQNIRFFKGRGKELNLLAPQVVAEYFGIVHGRKRAPRGPPKDYLFEDRLPIYLEMLHDSQRQAYQLRFVEKQDYETIAATMCRSVYAVQSLASAANVNLRHHHERLKSIDITGLSARQLMAYK